MQNLKKFITRPFQQQEDVENQTFVQNVYAGITSKVSDVQQAAYNWKNFAIFFGIGICLILLSFTFLPMIILVPAKFGALFSLGSICIITSLYVIKGTKNFIQMFWNKQIYSAAYLICLIGTIYFSILSKNYILVLIFSFLQMFSLAWLFASSFPAGITGMKFITRQIFSLFKRFISLFRTNQSSFLPI
ncbi:hypothetical protein pb186bvf_004376 [Paramecium bursaria]